MSKKRKWLIASILILFSILLFSKSIGLWSLGTNVDGDGIGLQFLGFEINDRVSEENIPRYAAGFFTSGIIIISLAFLGVKLKSRE
jgi:hypothetical protein